MTDGEEAFAQYTEEFFPEAIHTLDVMHAIERLWDAGRCLFREGSEELNTWVEDRKEQLYKDRIWDVICNIDDFLPTVENAKKYERLDKIANYFAKRADTMMNYQELREKDLEIGSGMIEGAVRYVVSQRFDEGGMRWIKERAEQLLQLRCIELNGHWETFLTFAHKRIMKQQQSKHRAYRVQSKQPEPLPVYGVLE